MTKKIYNYCLWLSEGTSRKSSKKSHRETSIKMPITPPRPRKPPSRFSLRRLFFENPLMPPPFRPSPRSKPKNKSNKPDENQLWKDNNSSASSVLGAQAQSFANGVRECPLCMAECTLEQFPLLRNCPHLFCKECLHTYVKIEIQEGRANLKCPQCTELMHPNGKTCTFSIVCTHLLYFDDRRNFSTLHDYLLMMESRL